MFSAPEMHHYFSGRIRPRAPHAFVFGLALTAFGTLDPASKRPANADHCRLVPSVSIAQHAPFLQRTGNTHQNACSCRVAANMSVLAGRDMFFHKAKQTRTDSCAFDGGTRRAPNPPAAASEPKRLRAKRVLPHQSLAVIPSASCAPSTDRHTPEIIATTKGTRNPSRPGSSLIIRQHSLNDHSDIQSSQLCLYQVSPDG